ncbi:hypothetical protein [Granulicella arctica]|uniref:hypothetical protein n=1 Tax=Granulicella arctica TaxID=940613 RepID=UPI0021E0C744|nr:hypothetical protein [Granulicella arctica]
MKLYSLLLAALCATSGLAVASDPFLGTWVYNVNKSPKPTITYQIEDLGENQYALTGSSGETTRIKADGISIKSPSGATVSFRKLDDHTWQMDRVESRSMKRTYTVSPDDRSLTLVDVFTSADGAGEKTTTMYARTSPGRSIFGQWKSVSMDVELSGPAEKFIIEPFGKDGLSFISESGRHHMDMKFDGRQYFDVAADGTKVDSSSGERIDDHLIHMESQTKGSPVTTDEYKVSDDGKTLTIVSKAVKTSAVFTSIWDKQ